MFINVDVSAFDAAKKFFTFLDFFQSVDLCQTFDQKNSYLTSNI